MRSGSCDAMTCLCIYAWWNQVAGGGELAKENCVSSVNRSDASFAEIWSQSHRTLCAAVLLSCSCPLYWMYCHNAVWMLLSKWVSIKKMLLRFLPGWTKEKKQNNYQVSVWVDFHWALLWTETSATGNMTKNGWKIRTFFVSNVKNTQFVLFRSRTFCKQSFCSMMVDRQTEEQDTNVASIDKCKHFVFCGNRQILEHRI